MGLLGLNCEDSLAEVEVTNVYRYFTGWDEAIVHKGGF